jgi:uncharacterized protein (TIGR02466 family)
MIAVPMHGDPDFHQGVDMESKDSGGFRHLWPVLFLERSLPSHEYANRALERLVLECEAGNENLTTDYRAGDFLAGTNSAVVWLRQCVEKTVADYCHRAGVHYPLRWSLHGWPSINRLGDYHDPHNHPHAYLSGTYYVRVPRSRTTRRNRADVRPGCITFYDPRASANMTAIRGDPQIEAEFTVSPAPGMILMWPSFLMHFVHPNLSEEPRISISFNVVVTSPGSYLPDQQ